MTTIYRIIFLFALLCLPMSAYAKDRVCKGKSKLDGATWVMRITKLRKDLLGYKIRGVLIGTKRKKKVRYSIRGTWTDVANLATGSLKARVRTKKGKARTKKLHMEGHYRSSTDRFVFQIFPSNPKREPLIMHCLIDEDTDHSPFSPRSTPTPTPTPQASGRFDHYWQCPYRGGMQIFQSGNRITGGHFSGVGYQHWAPPMNGTIPNSGGVNGNTASFRMNHNNGNYGLVTVTLSSSGTSFSGTWQHFASNGTFISSGTWDCSR